MKSAAIHRFGLGAIGRADMAGALRFPIQSGDFADSVAAVQNLAGLPAVQRQLGASPVFPCLAEMRSGPLQTRWN